MSVWRDSAVISVLLFVLAALLVTVPALARHYRRYGALTLRSAAIGSMLLLYGCGVAAFTLFPLPGSRAESCIGGSVAPKWNPLDALRDLRQSTAGLGAAAALGSFAFLQIAFNVLLFVPFGVFLCYYRRSLPFTACAGVAGSVLIEATQLSGVWGSYPCAYRTADTADVVLNASGCVLGWLLLRPVPLRAVPPPDLRSTSRSRAAAGLPRDLLSAAADLITVVVACEALAVATLAVGYSLSGASFSRSARVVSDVGTDALSAAAVLVLAVAPLLRRDHATLGQAAVLLRPVHRRAPASPVRVILRQVVRWGPVIAAVAIGTWWLGAAWLAVELSTAVLLPGHRSIAARLSGTSLRAGPVRSAGGPPAPMPATPGLRIS